MVNVVLMFNFFRYRKKIPRGLIEYFGMILIFDGFGQAFTFHVRQTKRKYMLSFYRHGMLKPECMVNAVRIFQ